MAESSDEVIIETSNAVMTLTLNRPEVLNSMNSALMSRLKAGLDEAERGAADGTVRAVVITGAGRGFCAGADLGDPAIRGRDGQPLADLGEYLRRNYHPVIEQLRSQRPHARLL